MTQEEFFNSDGFKNESKLKLFENKDNLALFKLFLDEISLRNSMIPKIVIERILEDIIFFKDKISISSPTEIKDLFQSCYLYFSDEFLSFLEMKKWDVFYCEFNKVCDFFFEEKKIKADLIKFEEIKRMKMAVKMLNKRFVFERIKW